jgi:membrane associated rhomboid family serine protease
MNEWINNIEQLIMASRQNLVISAYCVGALWVIHFINIALGMRLHAFGVIPRKPYGVIGIITHPFIHGHFEHLFFNSIALFILVDLLLIYGIPTFVITTMIITLITGILVWCFARPGMHTGASGIMMGYWKYLLANEIITKYSMSWLLGALCLYYLGGLGLNLLPDEPGTSWESHVFGAFAGVVAVFLTPLVIVLWVQ